jgi:hypothetical protein
MVLQKEINDDNFFNTEGVYFNIHSIEPYIIGQ